MIVRWLVAICVLPGTVLVVVPLVLLMLCTPPGPAPALARPSDARFWIAGAVFLVGSLLGLWTMSLFFRFGGGTPAPWDPPTRLVVRGPYRHVRNPMIIAVLAILLAQSLFIGSWLIAAWAGLFLVGNALYFPLVEEPALAARFGRDYLEYCRGVHRWIPRWTPWSPRG